MSVKPYKTILVPIDGSESSQLALEHAIYLAELCPTTITLVHVVNLAAVPALSPYDQGYYTLFKELQDALEAAGKKIIAEATLKIPEIIKSTSSLEFGSPGHIIIEFAEKYQADLIIMGSRGLGPVKGLLMGSVSNYVSGHATVPVMLVK
jgi:nucleotide-binding universal stress UspA family protein